jgi:hypothetical protein
MLNNLLYIFRDTRRLHLLIKPNNNRGVQNYNINVMILKLVKID